MGRLILTPSTHSLLDTLRVDKRLVFASLVLDSISAGAEGSILLITYLLIAFLQKSRIPSIDLSFFGHSISTSQINELPESYIVVFLLIALLGFQIIQSTTRLISRLSVERIATNAHRRIAQRLTTSLLVDSDLVADNATSGEIITIANEAPEGFKTVIENSSTLAVSLLLIIIYSYSLVLISPTDLFISILFMVPGAVLILFLSNHLKAISKATAFLQANVNSFFGEIVQGAYYIRATGSVSFITTRLYSNINEYISSLWRRTIIFESIQPISKVWGVILLCIVIALFTLRMDYSQQGVMLPKLVIFLISLQRLIGKASDLVNVTSTLSRNNGRLKLYDKYFQTQKITKAKRPATQLCLQSNSKYRATASERIHKLPEKIISMELSNVSYAYPNSEKKSLSNVNINVNIGSVVGIVGPSGSGKSTLFKLLAGLSCPDSGDLILNGFSFGFTSLTSVDLGSRVKLVSQTPFILNSTILDNICFGQQYDSERMNDILERLNLTSLLSSLPAGLSTVVGYGAHELSGGEQQRITLARAFYKQGDIMLLDEFTSALDAANQAFAVSALRHYSKDCITILTTHTRMVMECCDHIFVLHNGVIVSHGTLAELEPLTKLTKPFF